MALFLLLVAIVFFGNSYLGKREDKTGQSSWVVIGMSQLCWPYLGAFDQDRRLDLGDN